MFYRKTVLLQSFDNANCDYQAEVEIFSNDCFEVFRELF